MTAEKRVVCCFVSLLLLMECAATTSAAPIASASPGNAQITILYDAFGKESTMQKDWGYAALVEYGGKRILFDTGNNPEILAQNAKAKGVDLTKLDDVAPTRRSHGRTGPRIEGEPHGEDFCT
jgi:7,8-dihydropterin-6-yl-methyl-4-(beta-D-ribofuranosyl)aminobenzene 5'-phosphate synthase